MFFPIDGTNNLFSHLFRFQHHGITELAIEQIRIHKSRTYIREADMPMPIVRQLFERLQIHILHRFGCGIRRSWTQTFRTRNGSDGCDMSTTTTDKIAVCRPYHADKTKPVGLHRGKFDSFIQFVVLFAYAR